MTSLPIVDISPFLNPNSSSASRVETARTLDHACRTVGFFYLSSHNIPTGDIHKILSLANTFFALPASEKELIKLKPAGVGDGDRSSAHRETRLFARAAEIEIVEVKREARVEFHPRPTEGRRGTCSGWAFNRSSVAA